MTIEEVLLSNELIRLGTFMSWLDQGSRAKWKKVNINDFVKEGFYFTGSGDVVRCFSCGLKIRASKYRHYDLFSVHLSKSPYCSLVVNIRCGRGDKRQHDRVAGAGSSVAASSGTSDTLIRCMGECSSTCEKTGFMKECSGSHETNTSTSAGCMREGTTFVAASSNTSGRCQGECSSSIASNSNTAAGCMGEFSSFIEAGSSTSGRCMRECSNSHETNTSTSAGCMEECSGFIAASSNTSGRCQGECSSSIKASAISSAGCMRKCTTSSEPEQSNDPNFMQHTNLDSSPPNNHLSVGPCQPLSDTEPPPYTEHSNQTASSFSCNTETRITRPKPSIQRAKSSTTEMYPKTNSIIRATRQQSNPGFDMSQFQESKEARFETFTRWPGISMAKAKEFSQAGFIYIGPADRVKCAFCGGMLRSWNSDDSPMKEHCRYYPQCSFVVKYLLAKALPNPKHPAYRRESNRLRSFSGWDVSWNPRPLELAQAGFFYSGYHDSVKCFYCDGGLCDWEQDDDPWKEHARVFPGCRFLEQSKGKAFVQEVLRENNMAEHAYTRQNQQSLTGTSWQDEDSTSTEAFLDIDIKQEPTDEPTDKPEERRVEDARKNSPSSNDGNYARTSSPSPSREDARTSSPLSNDGDYARTSSSSSCNDREDARTSSPSSSSNREDGRTSSPSSSSNREDARTSSPSSSSNSEDARASSPSSNDTEDSEWKSVVKSMTTCSRN